MVQRGRSGAAEDERDRQVLGWVARFPGVTAELIACRFGVSRQRANARLRRLEAAGLVIRRGDFFQELYVSVTRRGFTALGLPRRRPPAGTHGRHEQLVEAWLVVHLELAGARVMTRREMRDDDVAAYSLAIRRPQRAAQMHLPVAVVLDGDRPIAVDIAWNARPFDPVVRAYTTARYAEVWFLVSEPHTAARIMRSIRKHRLPKPPAGLTYPWCPDLVVKPWPSLDDDRRAAVLAALSSRP